MPRIASVSVDVKLNLDPAKRQITDFGHSGGRIAGGKFEQGFTQHMKSAQSRMSSVSNSVFAGVAAGMTTALVSAAASATQAIGQVGASILKVGADAEKSKVFFTTFLGSAEKASAVLKDITKFAAETPFELPEVEKAAKQLLAFGFTAEQLKPTLTAVGNIAAGTGTNFSELADIIGKAKTQGRLYAEDINQLTGRGIPIIQALAKQYGVAESEVKKLVEQGKVGFPELEKALVSMTSEGGRFEGLMAKLAQTTGGKFTNLSDRITQSFTKIFENIQPAINAALDVAASFFDGLQVDFKSINDLAKTFAGWLVNHKDEAKAIAQVIGSSVTKSLQTINSLAQDFSRYLERNPAILKVIGGAVDLIGKGFQLWGSVLNDALTAVKAIADVFGKIIGFLDTAIQKAKQFTSNFANGWGEIWGGSGGAVAAGAYHIADPHDPNVTSHADASPHHTYQSTSRGIARDLTISRGGRTNVAVPSPITGRIKFAGSKGDYGNAVVLETSDGQEIILGHFASVAVKAGQTVNRGQSLGIQGNTGNSKGVHIHIEAPTNVLDAYYESLRTGKWGLGGAGGERNPAIAKLLGLDGVIANNQFTQQYKTAQSANSAAGFQSWLGGIRQSNSFATSYASAAQYNAQAKYDAINQSVERSQDYASRWTRLSEVLQLNIDKTKELQYQLRDGLMASVGDAFKSVISGTKSLGQAALDMLGSIASKLADLAINSIIGGNRGGGGILGTLLGGLFGGGGSSFGISPVSLPIPHFATGGLMQRDGLAYLHQGEQVLTPGQQRGAGQVVINAPITITNNGEGAMSEAQANRLQMQASESFRRIVEAELFRQRKPGGMLY
jgi:tape measure domain-containing protein